MSTTKLVQVKMTDHTLLQLEDIKNRIHVETITGAIKSSIAIADMVTEAINKGANVVIEEKNGEKYRIRLAGVSNG